jgi:hypothetical protein
MKRFTWMLLSAATLAGSGCLFTDRMPWEREVTKAKEADQTPPPPPRPVSADELTEGNAAAMADALAAELDRAASEQVAQPASVREP